MSIEIPHEYVKPKTIRASASSIGTIPIHSDHAKSKTADGFFVAVFQVRECVDKALHTRCNKVSDI